MLDESYATVVVVLSKYAEQRDTYKGSVFLLTTCITLLLRIISFKERMMQTVGI